VLNAVILLAACTTPATAATVETADRESVPDHDLASGERVFTTTCLSCHGKGEHGAPRPDSASDWEERLKQTQQTLARHAINGHGRMPPKGGFFNLSDAEVEAAVAYVVDRSQTIVTALKEKKSKTSCHPIKNPNACSDKELEDIITLHMLWLLGSPGDSGLYRAVQRTTGPC
jgi:cytochrome c5